ncbi:helix-turn-helix domain-containing protein [Salmonella enterica subsp. enterica]|nr:helix-turn-helix domain-containing protein [Salmonella enterica subsp. enterica]
MTGLSKAIRLAGGQSRLAALMGISRSSVNRWLHKFDGRVPPERLIQIFQLTGVTPHELRPDLYPNPSDGLANPAETSPESGGLNEMISESVRECAEAHCAVIRRAPSAEQEREALEAIAALAPFAPGHRVLIIPKSQ